jgi:hypothetical protein
MGMPLIRFRAENEIGLTEIADNVRSAVTTEVVLKDSDGVYHCRRYWEARPGNWDWNLYEAPLTSDPEEVIRWLCRQ